MGFSLASRSSTNERSGQMRSPDEREVWTNELVRKTEQQARQTTLAASLLFRTFLLLRSLRNAGFAASRIQATRMRF